MKQNYGRVNLKNIKRLDIVKGAGHCPHDENPKTTNSLICDFIQKQNKLHIIIVSLDPLIHHVLDSLLYLYYR